MWTRTAWCCVCWPPTRRTKVTSPCRSTSRSSRRSAATTTSTSCACRACSAWLPSWASPRRTPSPATCTACSSRTRTRTPGRARGWRRWRVTAPRVATGTSGCRSCVCRSAEPFPAPSRPGLEGLKPLKKNLNSRKKTKKEGETASSNPQRPKTHRFYFSFEPERRKGVRGGCGGNGGSRAEPGGGHWTLAGAGWTLAGAGWTLDTGRSRRPRSRAGAGQPRAGAAERGGDPGAGNCRDLEAGTRWRRGLQKAGFLIF